jgi:uncharacterized damage-inducible protein DinB
MSEAKRIADQMRRALRGPAWHGDSLAEILPGVTAEQAAKVAIPVAHTIHALVLHLAAWAEIALERVIAGETREIADSENFPAPGDWASDVERLFASTDRLAAHVENMSDTELQFVLEPNTQSVYNLLHGIVQHHIYHAGQIVLLKKLV